MDDLDLDGLAGDVAAIENVVADLPDDGAVTGQATPEPSTEEAQEDAYDRIFDGDKTADRESSDKWAKEQRRLADAALERAGIEPSQRHERGLSRREVTRRLFAAEQALRSDPSAALPSLARDYAAGLDQAGKLRVAAGIMSSLGLQHAGQISEADRAQLQQYQSQEAQRAQALEEARPQVEQSVQQFAQAHPDFQQLRPLMSSLVSSGQAHDLATAYDMARRASGLPDRAKAADDARRAKVAAAKAAGTPQTKSDPTLVDDPLAGKSLREAHEDAYDRIFGRE